MPLFGRVISLSEIKQSARRRTIRDDFNCRTQHITDCLKPKVSFRESGYANRHQPIEYSFSTAADANVVTATLLLGPLGRQNRLRQDRDGCFVKLSRFIETIRAGSTGGLCRKASYFVDMGVTGTAGFEPGRVFQPWKIAPPARRQPMEPSLQTETGEVSPGDACRKTRRLTVELRRAREQLNASHAPHRSATPYGSRST